MKKIVFIIFLFISVLAHAQIEVVPTQIENIWVKGMTDSELERYNEQRYTKGVILRIGEYESKFIKGGVKTYDSKYDSFNYENLKEDKKPTKPTFDMASAFFEIEDRGEREAFYQYIYGNRKEILEKYGIYMYPYINRIEFCYYEDWEAFQADCEKYNEVLDEWEKQKENRIESLNNLL